MKSLSDGDREALYPKRYLPSCNQQPHPNLAVGESRHERGLFALFYIQMDRLAMKAVQRKSMLKTVTVARA